MYEKIEQICWLAVVAILITFDKKFYAFIICKSLIAQLQQYPVIVIEAMIPKD